MATQKTIGQKWVRLAGAFVALCVAAGLFLIFHTKPHSPSIKGDQGLVKIETTPPGANVFLDGRLLRDRTNATVVAASGQHTVKLELQNYDPQEIQVLVRKGVTIPVQHTFTVHGLAVVGPVNPNGQAAITYRDDQLQTYKNEKFHYTMKYPKDWLAQTDPSGVLHLYDKPSAKALAQNPGAEVDEALAILVLDNPKQLLPKAWFQAREEYPQEDQAQIKQQDTTVAGQPAYYYETPYGFFPSINTILTHGDKAYLLQQKQGSPDRAIYQQLIQTLSFT
jgi:hypothetical protein